MNSVTGLRKRHQQLDNSLLSATSSYEHIHVPIRFGVIAHCPISIISRVVGIEENFLQLIQSCED
jgi:hypothetical protein